jgi:hypothetical protein
MLFMSRADFSSAKGLLAWRPKPKSKPTAAPAHNSRNVFMRQPVDPLSVFCGDARSRLERNRFQAELSPALAKSYHLRRLH